MGEQSKKDYTRFDAMSTEELNMFLRGYLNAPESDDSNNIDMDAVLYAMEVVTKREKKTNPEKYPSVENSWLDFYENYLMADIDAKNTEKKNSKKIGPINNAHNKTLTHSSTNRWRSMGMLSRICNAFFRISRKASLCSNGKCTNL